MLYKEAKKLSDKIKRSIKFERTTKFKVYQTGSVAREEEHVKDIDFLIVTDKFIDNLLESLYFTERSGVVITKLYSCGDRRCSIQLKIMGSGIHSTSHQIKIDLFYALKCNLPFALLAWIGPGIYNIRVRKKASSLGYLLNQYGLWDKDTGKKIEGNFKTQADIQKFLGITVRPPYQRR